MANRPSATLSRAAATSGNIKSFTITKRGGNGTSKAVDVTGAVAEDRDWETLVII